MRPGQRARAPPPSRRNRWLRLPEWEEKTARRDRSVGLVAFYNRQAVLGKICLWAAAGHMDSFYFNGLIQARRLRDHWFVVSWREHPMQIQAIGSSWSVQQAHASQSQAGEGFASTLAANGLSAQSSSPASGGQLLSDDMMRSLARFSSWDHTLK